MPTCTSLIFKDQSLHFLPGMKHLSSVNGFECERLKHNVIQTILNMEGNCEKWAIEDAIRCTMVFLTTRLHCYIYCVCKVLRFVNMLKLMQLCNKHEYVIDWAVPSILTMYDENSLSLSVALTSFIWVAKLCMRWLTVLHEWFIHQRG